MIDIFTSLRVANTARLPLFKNSRGATAHSKADGSDWTPLEWAGAMCGEVGELAEALLALRGPLANVTADKIAAARGELADVVCYADIVAMQFGLPAIVGPESYPCISSLTELAARMSMHAGAVANAAKKLRRGDHDAGDARLVGLVSAALYDLVRAALGVVALLGDAADLAEIVSSKFNAISARVGVSVRIERDGSVTGGGLDAARGRVRSILYTNLDERGYERASEVVDEIIAAVRQ